MGSAVALCRAPPGLARADAAERQAETRQRTQALARQLGEESSPDGDGWLLPAPMLYALCKSGGFEYLAFHAGDRSASVSLGHLRRVLGACRNTRMHQVRLGTTHLILVYDTLGSRGRLGLVVQPWTRDMDAVDAELGQRALPTPKPLLRSVPCERTQESVPVADPEDLTRTPEPSLAPPRGPVTARPTFWHHLESVLGHTRR